MQNVSPLYQTIVDTNEYYVESALIVCPNDVPLTDDLQDNGMTLNPLYAHNEEELWSIKTNRNVFSNDSPEVGCCTCGEIDVEMLYPAQTIPSMARLTPYVRVVPNVGLNMSAKNNVSISGEASSNVNLVDWASIKLGQEITIEFNATFSSDTGLSSASLSVGICTGDISYYIWIIQDNDIEEYENSYKTTFIVDENIMQAIQAEGEMKIHFAMTGRSSIPFLRYGSCSIRGIKITNDDYRSEWIRKGVFFIDTREVTKNDGELKILTLHGYDSMMKANAEYPWSSEASPTDIQAVDAIATAIGVDVDPRTTAIINKGYEVVAPIGYLMIENLAHIAGAYCGNFIINDLGMLQLIPLFDLPVETNYLTDDIYNILTFGGDRINLGEEA